MTDQKAFVLRPRKRIPDKFQPGFIDGMDQRCGLAKTLRETHAEVVEELGGIDRISRIKLSLIERFCWLETLLRTLEHEMSTRRDVRDELIGRWTAAQNSFLGLAKTLGLEKVPRKVDLVDYLREKSNDNEEEPDDIDAQWERLKRKRQAKG